MNALRQLAQQPMNRLILICSLGLAACSNNPVIEPATEPLAEAEVEPLPAQPFAAETLYALLVAELAGARGRYDIALSNYVDQAYKTRDLGLAKRSTLIARQLNAHKTALSSALLWAELAPNSNEAQLIATTELLNAGRYLEALEKSFLLKELGSHPLYVTIAAKAVRQPKQQQAVLAKLEEKLQRQPDDVQLLVAKGILLQPQQPQQSLDIARAIQVRDPELAAALMLEVKALIQLKRHKEARQRLEQLLQQYPNNKRLRLQYARLLASTDLAASRSQFEQLQLQSPKDAELTLALALVLYELEDLSNATLHFESLLKNPGAASISHYYLGRIKLSENSARQAYRHFSAVKPGPDFLAAQVHRLDILMAKGKTADAQKLLQQLYKRFPKLKSKLILLEVDAFNKYGHYQTAIDLMSDILSTQPQNTRILYQRAMGYNRLDQLQYMEQDLRKIIKLEPNNAGVLNDLGYTLMTRTARIAEAGKLIEQAFALQPKDPGIIDSMGWVEYHRGNYTEAVKLLRQAMALLPDHEIAAHLGEALWAMNRQQEALEVWQQGLELKADSDIIKATMLRLKAKP